MRKGNNIFILALVFILGFGAAYFLIQFSYFDMDMSINVIDTLLSIATALIGLYIAVSIQKKNSRNQSLHDLLQSNLTSLLVDFSKFEKKLSVQSSMQLNVATSSIKSLYQELVRMRSLFNSFSRDCGCIDIIEEKLDQLDDILTGSTQVVNNSIQINHNKQLILSKTNEVTVSITDTYAVINRIL